MKTFLMSFCAAVVASSTLIAGDWTPPGAFRSLYNGKDFSGWHGKPHYDVKALAAMSDADRANQLKEWNDDIPKHWRVEADGTIFNDGDGVYLTTDEAFGDYELILEYRTFANGDSGVYLKNNPQVQIWDFTEAGGKWSLGADKGSGGLWNNSPGAAGKDPLHLADRDFGEWNHLRVRQIGSRTSVWLNDVLVVDHALMENYFYRNLPLDAKGQIQLQTHGSDIYWRHLAIRELPTEEANQILLEKAGDGFQSIFNGKDFTGWQGNLENYEIKDGAIACLEGKGGNVFTEKEYADFVVALEFKLPPGGNNGLAIRYPGEGNAAYDGMTELQVLDSEAEMYKDLDARQYHGSVYGIAAATRGYLRPVGEWNAQVVTVKGPQITVELNGNKILDADVSTVTEYMADSAHPGKDRKSGYFGFAGHNDPVQFRNIRIKELVE